MSSSDRRALARDLLHHVLSVLEQIRDIGFIGVVSSEVMPAINVILDQGGGLNEAVAIGSRWAVDAGAEALLVLPADLPLLSTTDITDLLAMLPLAAGGVVAPSKDGGTGALALRPPQLIQPAFGPQSAARHLERIRATGAEAAELYRSGLALDVDEPEDLALLPGHEIFDVARRSN